MTLNQIKLLLALNAHELNLSAAAESLHIVQSAASRQLKQLEEELGVVLVQRHGKRLEGWTDAGEAVLQQARQICQAQRNIYNIACALQKKEEGDIVLGTTHTQAKYFLPEPLRRFRSRYPRVRIHIEQMPPVQLIERLRAGYLDFVLCTEAVRGAEQLEKRLCYRWHYALLLPRDHPLATVQSVQWAHLAEIPLLTYSSGFTGGDWVRAALEKQGLHADIVLRAADSDVIKTYVREGFGGGIVAAQSYEPERDKDLISLSLQHLLPCNETYVAWRQSHVLTPSMEELITWLQQASPQGSCTEIPDT